MTYRAFKIVFSTLVLMSSTLVIAYTGGGGDIGSFAGDPTSAYVSIRPPQMGYEAGETVNLIRQTLPGLFASQASCDPFLTRRDPEKAQICALNKIGGKLGPQLYDKFQNTIILQIDKKSLTQNPELWINGSQIQPQIQSDLRSNLNTVGFEVETLVFQFEKQKFATEIKSIELRILAPTKIVEIEISLRDDFGQSMKLETLRQDYANKKHKTRAVDLLALIKSKASVQKGKYLQSVKINTEKNLFTRMGAVILNGTLVGMPKELPFVFDSHKTRFPIVFRDDTELSEIDSLILITDEEVVYNSIEIEIGPVPRLLDSKIIDLRTEIQLSEVTFTATLENLLGPNYRWEKVRNLTLLAEELPKAALFIGGYGFAKYSQAEVGVCSSWPSYRIDENRDCRFYAFWEGRRNFIDASDFVRKDKVSGIQLKAKNGRVDLHRIWIELE